MADASVPGATRSRWRQPRFVAAAAVVGVVAVLGVLLIVLAFPGGSTDEAATSPEPDAVPDEGGGAVDPGPGGEASVCGLPPGDQTIPVTTPTDTEWELVGTVATPTAPDTIGPGRVDEGFRSCFARSPLGALYATVNFVAMTQEAQFRLQAVEELTADGSGRDAAVDALREAGTPPAAEDERLQVAGFTFLGYDQDGTVVEVVARSEEGTLARLPVPLRWERGDWKVVVPPSGELYEGFRVIPDLTGYVPWSGV